MRFDMCHESDATRGVFSSAYSARFVIVSRGANQAVRCGVSLLGDEALVGEPPDVVLLLV